MNLSTALIAKSTAGALAGTGLVAASVLGLHTSASGASGTTTSVASTTPAKHACRAFGLHVKHAPEALRKDLEAARTKLRESDATGEAKRAERREVRQQIRAGIASGKYGEKLQQRAEKREANAAKHRAALPEQLRSDLDALKKTDPGQQRREAAAKIRKARLAGTYGAQVQQAAKKHQLRAAERKQACQDQRKDRREQRQDG